jgi:hypothetical protein
MKNDLLNVAYMELTELSGLKALQFLVLVFTKLKTAIVKCKKYLSTPAEDETLCSEVHKFIHCLG